MGRPTKLDDLTAKRIVDAVGRGLSRVGAAKTARVSTRALYEWLERGREETDDESSVYAQFLHRVREAEGKAECEVVDSLMEQVRKGHVGAMCFWLERRRREDWGRDATAVPANTTSQAVEEADVSVLESLMAAAKSKRAV